jgi:hypothetical protein
MVQSCDVEARLRIESVPRQVKAVAIPSPLITTTEQDDSSAPVERKAAPPELSPPIRRWWSSHGLIIVTADPGPLAV